jgi:transglutaminase-like putative cysteine protease
MRWAGRGPASVQHLRGWLHREWRRVLALALGTTLIGSYLSVFHQVTNVAGGVGWLAVGVGTAVVLASVFATRTTTRRGLLAGAALLLAGVATYVLLVPEIRGELLTVAFVRRWVAYLTGITVLQFKRADLWAVVVAPGPTFLSWFLLVRRRYAASALVGGVMLLFFTSTGDAGATTALVGWTSLLALLAAGTLEREAGGVDRLLELGFSLALGGLLARQVTLVPNADATTDPGGGGGGATADRTGEVQLDTTGPSADIPGAISLSPEVLFTIESDAVAYWHVSAYDRYTGTDWLRTGDVRPYTGPLEPPDGDAPRIEQAIRAEAPLRTLPAAWKPIELHDGPTDGVAVTELDGFVLDADIGPSQQYRVTSARPNRSLDRLRAAGVDAHDAIAERYGQLPADTPDRVRELAADLAGDSRPVDAAVAIQRWLRANKRYSLAVDRPEGDVVDAFLFSMDAGYCVYFATAMVGLLRATGIPARFVLGYSPGQRVAEGRWVVRGFDSHAWVQAHFPGVGWALFDPTPPAERYAARRNILEVAREEGARRVDTAETSGRRYQPGPFPMASVPGARAAATATTDRTDGSNATGSPQTAALTTPGSGETGETPGSAPVRSIGDVLEHRDRISLLAGGVATAIGLHWLKVGRWARDQLHIRWQVPTDSPARDVTRACRRLELAFARRGRPKADGETTRQYLERVGDEPTRGRRRRVIELYELATYGGGVTRAEADEAIRLVDELVGRG